MTNYIQLFFKKIKLYFNSLLIIDEKENWDMPNNTNKYLEDMFTSLIADDLKIEIADNLSEFMETDSIHELRTKIKENTGFIIPLVAVTVNDSLQDNEYKIFIRNNEVFEGSTVPVTNYAEAEIIYNLEKICKEHINEIFTNKISEKYIDLIQRNNNKLLWEISWYIKPTDIRAILVDLLRMEKSIKDIEYIFEQIGQYAYLGTSSRIIGKIANDIENFRWEISFERPEVLLPKFD